MRAFVYLVAAFLLCVPCSGAQERSPEPPASAAAPAAEDGLAGPTITISAERLRDKVRGGLLGQLLGNLNGLPHEMKYIAQPGAVSDYVPALPEGAYTDDDTDLEWVYIVAMQAEGRTMLPPERIAALWRERINQRIWCANSYARCLMDLGLEPPLTGRIALNPWAEFNISGQFLCECFGLVAPAMPRTASQIGLNYTLVGIDQEPAQVTQLFCTMIAMAFVEDDLDRLVDAGLVAVDADCRVRQVAEDVRQWHRQHPEDWQQTRRLLHDKYSQDGGGMRDRNGYELNTGATVAALLYGRGDFAATLQLAFNFGWDADNVAATAGTILGVIKGYRWMLSQGWQIVDRYRNTSRDKMPEDETITSFADRLIELAQRTIHQQGGQAFEQDGRPVYNIRSELPGNVYASPETAEQIREMREASQAEIRRDLVSADSAQRRARAAYLAICLDLSGTLRQEHPAAWAEAIADLGKFWRIPQQIFYHSAHLARGAELMEKAAAAGLPKPQQRKDLW